MSQLNERGTRSERGSALWGTGGRGGDRSSVLWGKGGRGLLVASIAAVALAAPLAAMASPSHKAPTHARVTVPVRAKAPAKPTKKAPAKAKAVAKAPAKKAPAKKTPAKVPAKAPAAPKAPAAAPAPAATPTAAPAPAATPAASTPAPPVPSNGDDTPAWVDQGLLNQASSTPNDKLDVIVTSSGGTADAQKALNWLAKIAAKNGGTVSAGQDLNLVGGVALTLPAKLVAKLQSVPGLIVTPNAPVQLSGSMTNLTSSQVWPYESGNAFQWLGDVTQYSGRTPAIAVVDSGIQSRSDFGNRVVASVNLSTIDGNTSSDDQRGHGTFVAGIAAGAAPGLVGAAPGAPLVSVKVMDSNGMAKTSDVINACAWILAHKAQYNIRVANFSLHSSYGTNSYRDPLDQAVEKLWFSGVTVVAAAGNYGTAAGPSGVLYAPGNDPFVITVGAVDINGTVNSNDDTVAPWSAYGYTEDGFYKPEISAPGRYMVGPIPSDSTIAAQKSGSLVGSARIQLSGTSFAAPVVAGTVADMLARHPNWSPDQVKGDLMRTARKIRNSGNPRAAGLGELTASRAVMSTIAPNPNAGLDRFVSTPAGASSPVFDAQSWASAAQSDMSWNSMSWADVQSWSDMSWSDQSWSDMSWSDMSWADMSWSDMSWADMSWSDMSWADMSNEDLAEGDTLSGTDGYVASDTTTLDAATDPDTAIPVDGTDPATALGVDLTPATDPAATDPTADPTATDPAATDPTADPTATDPSAPATDPTASAGDPSATDPSASGDAGSGSSSSGSDNTGSGTDTSTTDSTG